MFKKRWRKIEACRVWWSYLYGEHSGGAAGPVSFPQPPVAPQALLRRVAGVAQEAHDEEDAEHEQDVDQVVQVWYDSDPWFEFYIPISGENFWKQSFTLEKISGSGPKHGKDN